MRVIMAPDLLRIFQSAETPAPVQSDHPVSRGAVLWADVRGIPILSRVLVSLLTEEKSPPVHLVASTAMQGRKRRAEAQLAGYISENFWPARVTPSN